MSFSNFMYSTNRLLAQMLDKEEKSINKSFAKVGGKHYRDQINKAALGSSFGSDGHKLKVLDTRFQRLLTTKRLVNAAVLDHYSNYKNATEQFDESVDEYSRKIENSQLKYFKNHGKIRQAVRICVIAALRHDRDKFRCYFIFSEGSGRLNEVWIGGIKSHPGETRSRIPGFGHKPIVSFIQDRSTSNFRTVR